MSALGTYLRERFPLGKTAPLALAAAACMVGVATKFSASLMPATALIAISFLAFLLRTRVTDEFKDARHDDSNYPNRPVQRGVISRSVLLRVGLLALLVEIVAAIAVGTLLGRPMAAFSYLAVLVFSALTAVEFFVPNWLERQFTLYFITHQLIFACFAFWIGNLFEPNLPGFFGFGMLMISIEVIRKFEIRRNASGEIVPDTYPAVWGRAVSVAVIFGSAIIGAALVSIGANNFNALAISIVVSAAAALRWCSDSAVKNLGALNFVVISLAVFFV